MIYLEVCNLAAVFFTALFFLFCSSRRSAKMPQVSTVSVAYNKSKSEAESYGISQKLSTINDLDAGHFVRIH